MRRYAARTDANHAEVRDAFRKLLGHANVIDTAKHGAPFYDLAITYGGLILLIETKTKKGKLTESQTEAKLPYKLVRDMDDVADAVATIKRWHLAITRG